MVVFDLDFLEVASHFRKLPSGDTEEGDDWRSFFLKRNWHLKPHEISPGKEFDSDRKRVQVLFENDKHGYTMISVGECKLMNCKVGLPEEGFRVDHRSPAEWYRMSRVSVSQ